MNKKILLGLFFGIFLIISSYSVLAAAASVVLNSPVTYGNYTTTINLNCTTNVNTTMNSSISGDWNYNVTFFYNQSGGITNTSLGTISNTSQAQTEFVNSSFTVSSYTQLSTYNFSCKADNGTTQKWASAKQILIDYTAPTSVTINVPANNYLNYSKNGQLIYLNVTVNDNLNMNLNISSVYFNITNSSGGQNGTYTASNKSAWWTTTLNTTNFLDGIYNITVYVTDRAGNINSSQIKYNIILDNTSPSISAFSCSPTSVNVGRATTCTCTASDVLLAITTTYTESPGVSSVGTHTLTCTSTDLVDNSASLTTTYSVTSGGVASTTPGTSGTTITWTNTLVVSNVQLEAGYTQELKAQERMKVSVAGAYHHVGVKSVTATSATIEITSDPISVILDIGQDAKVDLDKDGTFDLYVKLNSIANSKADVTVKKLSEAVPEGTGDILTSGKIETTTSGTGTDAGTGKTTGISKTWIYIVVVIVILVIAGIAIAKRKK